MLHVLSCWKRFYFKQLDDFNFCRLVEQGLCLLFTTGKQWEKRRSSDVILAFIICYLLWSGPLSSSILLCCWDQRLLPQAWPHSELYLNVLLINLFALLTAFPRHKKDAKDRFFRCTWYSPIIRVGRRRWSHLQPLEHSSPKLSPRIILGKHPDILGNWRLLRSELDFSAKKLCIEQID